jgi:FlaG/FlaF family flagellin (archaellin)
MRKRSSGVSPVIGVLLLLGLTVGFIALTSNILFDIFDNPADPTTEIEITHNESDGGISVNVLIIRNQNIDEYSYIVGSTRCYINKDNAIVSGESFRIPSDGETSTGDNCGNILNIENGDEIVIRGRVGSDLFVIENYRIPET